MGPKPSILLATASLGWCAPSAPPVDPGGQRIFTQIGYAEDGREEDGHSSFRLDEPEQRFRLPAGSAEAVERYWQLIEDANRRGVAVHIRYDGSAGEVHADEGYVEYPLCTLAAAPAARLGNEAENCPPRPAPAATAAEARVALALAYAPGAPARARALLDVALADERLAVPLRGVVFKTRGAIAEARAEAAAYPSREFDQALADALGDYRSWAEAAPAERKAQYGIARTLGALGGYGEALRLYAAILRRWPEEDYEVAVRSGALFRGIGDPARALRQLDEFAARAGPPEGMRFHYHRGWTLLLLGRDSEAAAELTRGLSTQPDYAYAYLRRSCAEGRQGRIAAALGDAQRGLELLRGMRALPSPWLADEIERTEAVVATLRRADAAGSRAPVAAPCETLDDRWASPRPRSRLLDIGAGRRRPAIAPAGPAR